MTKAAQIRVLLGQNRLTNDQLVSAGTAALKGLEDNPKVTNPPVSIADFKGQLQSFGLSVAAARDGGRTAIALRDKERAAFLKMMRKMALYVEEIAGTDATVVANAGFQVRPGRKPAAPLDQPSIDQVTQKNTGEQQVSPSPVKGAIMYETEYGVPGPGGTPPTAWTTVQAPSARPGPVITGLIPGTVYVFRVRAYGKRGGWTAWSDPVTKMST